MTYIPFRRSPRVRVLAVAAVVALHVLLWFGMVLKRPVAGPADVHVTYADLRFVEPRPVRPQARQPEDSAQAEPQAALVRRPPTPRPTAPIQLRAAPLPEVAAAPSEAPAPSELLPAEPSGKPDAQGQALDMEALRSAARDFERTREKTPIEKHRAQWRQEQHRDVAAEAIAKSARADCRNAYSGLGLLALIPLAVDAVREGGCKW